MQIRRYPSLLTYRPSNPALHVRTTTTRHSAEQTEENATTKTSFFMQRSPYRQLILLLCLFLYQFIGAVLFLLCEAENQRRKEGHWERELADHRRKLVENITKEVQTASSGSSEEYANLSEVLLRVLPPTLIPHEQMLLDWRWEHPRMRWDFWNAMLFSLSIFTTIGYGHLYAKTRAGRLLTILYALGGIPLLMLVLEQFSALLNRLLRFSWFLFKCACRRAFRSCAHQSMAQIRALDAQESREMRCPSTLPLPVAFCVLFAWISMCAGLACLWERQWDFWLAFYFFFTSMTTIGLGDVTPQQREPRYLMLFSACLIVGLALVSMTIGLVQAKTTLPALFMSQRPNQSTIDDDNNNNESNQQQKSRSTASQLLRRHLGGSSLGVFSTTNTSSSRGSAVRERLRQRQWHSRCSQTVLSFPNPGILNARVANKVARNGLKMLPHSLSIDDVMRLVDTEEGDILLLSELTLSREQSGLTETEATDEEGSTAESSGGGDRGGPFGGRFGVRLLDGTDSSSGSGSARICWTSGTLGTSSSSGSGSAVAAGTTDSSGWEDAAQRRRPQVVLSRSFDHSGFASTSASSSLLPAADIPLIYPLFSSLLAHGRTPNSMRELELLEELEDRMLLSHGADQQGGGSAIGNFHTRRTAAGPGMAGWMNRPASTAQQPMPPPLFSVLDNVAAAGVHFRSRLSLIPEQRSIDEEELEAFGEEMMSREQATTLNHRPIVVEEVEDAEGRTGTGSSSAGIDELESGTLGKRRQRAKTSHSWSSGLSALLFKGAWKQRRKEKHQQPNPAETAEKRSYSLTNDDAMASTTSSQSGERRTGMRRGND